MGYIYKITNQINQKSYIGLTTQAYDERWKQHIRSIGTNNEYAIHKAFKKYGIENFSFEIIEECDNSLLAEKEKFWIKQFNTFLNGYNLTRGGEGYLLIDYDAICKEYINNSLSCAAIAKKFNIDKHTVGKILTLNNIEHNAEIYQNMKELSKIGALSQQKKIRCLNKKTEELIKEFNSETEAANWILEQNLSNNKGKGSIQSHISRVCRGINKSAYGFKWTYY